MAVSKGREKTGKTRVKTSAGVREAGRRLFHR